MNDWTYIGKIGKDFANIVTNVLVNIFLLLFLLAGGTALMGVVLGLSFLLAVGIIDISVLPFTHQWLIKL